jgi:uncharacterized protein DUF5908
MPIEIKELHIRVAVNTSQNGQASEVHTASSDENKGDTDESDKDTIVAECVEQVLQILQNKKER